MSGTAESVDLVSTINYFFDNVLGLDGSGRLAQVVATGAGSDKQITIQLSTTLSSGVRGFTDLFSFIISDKQIDKYINKEIDLTHEIDKALTKFVDPYVNQMVEGIDGVERGVAVAATDSLKNLMSARILGELAPELARALKEFDVPRADALTKVFDVSLTDLSQDYFKSFVPGVVKAYGKIGIAEILDAATADLGKDWKHAVSAVKDGVLEPILSNIVDRYFTAVGGKAPEIFKNVEFTKVLADITSHLLINFDALDKQIVDDILGIDGHGWLESRLQPMLTNGINDFVQERFIDALDFLSGKFTANDLDKVLGLDKIPNPTEFLDLLGNVFARYAGTELAKLIVEIDSLPEAVFSQLGSFLASEAFGGTLGTIGLNTVGSMLGFASNSVIGGAIFNGLGVVLGAGIGAVVGAVVFEVIDNLFNGAISGFIGDIVDWIRNDSPQAFYRVKFNPEKNEFEFSGRYSKDSNAKLDNAVKSMSDAFEESVDSVFKLVGQPAHVSADYDEITMVWGKKHFSESFASFREGVESWKMGFGKDASAVVGATIGAVLRRTDFRGGDAILDKAYETWKAYIGENAADAAFATPDALTALQKLISLAKFANQYRQDSTLFDQMMAGDTPVGVTVLQQFMEAQALGFNDATTLKGSVLKQETIGSSAAGDTIYLDGSARVALARGGDDVVWAGTAAHQEVDGGTGTDTLVLSKARASYTVKLVDRASHTVLITDKTTNSDIKVANVERFILGATGASPTGTESLSFSQLIGNRAPVITTAVSAAVHTVTVVEGSRDAASFAAIDQDGDTLTYTISGSDADSFVIDSKSGTLSFRDSQSYARLSDKNGDGLFEITVTATDGVDNDSKAVYVLVGRQGDVVTPGAILQGGTGPEFIGPDRSSPNGVKSLAGDDIIFGGAGADTILGDKGNDFISGGDGNDSVVGDDGADLLSGGDGNDSLFGADGDDRIQGGPGDDVLYGDAGDDTIFGAVGNDKIFGSAGNDRLVLDKVRDAYEVKIVNRATQTISLIDKAANTQIEVSGVESFVFGQQAGATTLSLGKLIANQDPIFISGIGSGYLPVSVAEKTTLVVTLFAKDLDGDAVTYAINGGADADKFTIDAKSGRLEFRIAPDRLQSTDKNGDGLYEVTVTASDGMDADTKTIYAFASQGSSPASPGNIIFGDAGPNRIGLDGSVVGQPNASTSDDIIFAGGGADQVVGDKGRDMLIGGDGADTLHGGVGDDSLMGDADDDQLWGDEGHDLLRGWTGADQLDGGSGNDTLIGGRGSDTISGGDGSDLVLLNATASELYFNWSNGQLIVSGGGDRDVYSGVEYLVAKDGQVILGTSQKIGTFDEGYYLNRYPDVAAAVKAGAVGSGLEHWLEFGEKEGRQAINSGQNPFYDEGAYLAANPDVAAAVRSGAYSSGYAHFLVFGKVEGRISVPFFDKDYYLAHNPDVKASGIDAWTHFMNYGWREDRDPSQFFDVSVYLDKYQDVKAAGVNPLEHALLNGIREGRTIFATHDFSWDII